LFLLYILSTETSVPIFSIKFFLFDTLSIDTLLLLSVVIEFELTFEPLVELKFPPNNPASILGDEIFLGETTEESIINPCLLGILFLAPSFSNNLAILLHITASSGDGFSQAFAAK
jgi:hypothetical protein